MPINLFPYPMSKNCFMPISLRNNITPCNAIRAHIASWHVAVSPHCPMPLPHCYQFSMAILHHSQLYFAIVVPSMCYLRPFFPMPILFMPITSYAHYAPYPLRLMFIFLHAQCAPLSFYIVTIRAPRYYAPCPLCSVIFALWPMTIG